MVGAGVTYEELSESGLLMTDKAVQKKNRIELVSDLIGSDGVQAVLTDAGRIHRVFPAPKPEKRSG